MQSFLGNFQGKVHLGFKLDGEDTRKTVSLRRPGVPSGTAGMPLFLGGGGGGGLEDRVAGALMVTPKSARKVEHQGIKVELLGLAEVVGQAPAPFLALSRQLEGPGMLVRPAKLRFDFEGVEMAHESYAGMQVKVRYVLRATLQRAYGMSQTAELELWVRNPAQVPDINTAIKMEVGIEDCLHIEFEYNRSKYHLRDVVVGKIYFLLVRIHIKHMEIEIKRRETIGSGAQARSESETVAKYEVMDGEPASRECIPIRLYLSNYDLTPTYGGVLNKFSVKYFLQLVLVDEEDRRYFKSQVRADKRPRRRPTYPLLC